MQPSFRETGTIKSFFVEKGFGFVRADRDRAEIFVHISAVQDPLLGKLQTGERIEFERMEGGRGLKAVAVRRVV